LFAIPLIPFALIAFYLGGMTAGIVMVLAGSVISLSIYRMSPELLLRWYGARKFSDEDCDLIFSHLSEISGKLNVPCPVPCIFDSAAPIAFTVGNKKKYYLLISKSALDILDRDELRSILTLEIAKISQRTVAVNTIVALFAGAIASFSTVALWMAMLTGFGQENDPAPRFISFLVMGMVSLPSALLVHLFSVDSTKEADCLAAEAMEDPGILAKALGRSGTFIKLHVTGGLNPGHAHLFSVNPLKTNTLFDVYSSMFLTKPAVEQRVMYLENAKPVSQ